MNSLSEEGVLARLRERFGDRLWREDGECRRFTFGQIGWA